MTDSPSARFGYVYMLPGLLALILGGLGLFGWIADFPLLTRINPDWKPMVPATALCFVLGGLSLLTYPISASRPVSITHRLLVWLVLLLAGARMVELLTGRDFGIEFLLPALGSQLAASGHMAHQTTAGFIVFGIGMLALQRADSRKARILAEVLAVVLLAMGAIAAIGYWLDFQLVFESLYASSGLLWMSLPTAIGLFVLGLGLQCLALKCRQHPDNPSVVQQGAQVYRTTLLVLFVTALATGLAGVSFLQETVRNQAGTDMSHSLDAIRSHIDTSLDNRIQRARGIGMTPTLSELAIRLIGRPGAPASGMQSSRLAEELLAQQLFSGIAVESGQQRWILAGHLLPDTTRFFRLRTDTDAALAWDQGYVLRVRVPVSRPTPNAPEGFLVFEQRLQQLDKIFAEANHWGRTGTLPMCTRLDPKRLLCFPQREQTALYELLIALPLILIMVSLGLWIVRWRVQPLLQDIARAHASESATKTRFDVAMQSSPDPFVIYESVRNAAGDIVDFQCVYLNRAAESMPRLAYGKQARNLLGKAYLQTFPERGEVFAQYRQVALTGELQVDEVSWANDAGEFQTYLRQAVPMPQGIAVTYRDITEERNLLKKLEHSNRLRSSIVESAAYSIISTDVDGTILSFNQAAERMLWYRADELVGKATPAVFHDTDEISERARGLSEELGRPVAPGFEVFVAKAQTHFQEEHEWTYVRKDGSRFPVRLSITALRDENDTLQGYLGIAYDISEQKRAEEYIRHIALHDMLTGLPNRVLLDDRVTVAIEQHKRHPDSHFALAMLDIDRFKHINDSMGHHIGDLLLKQFVERIQSCLRPADTLARMGGDEFVLLLPDSDETGAQTVLERIRHVLTPPINVGVQEVHITASVGVSLYPADGETLHELLRCADVAMYWVKEHGRNGFKVFSRAIDSGGANRLSFERDLHLALDNNGFSLFYQPKVDLKSDAVYGVEALLRMRRANGQLVSPADFIPLAEDTGLIIPMGQWVLETACRDAALMQQALGTPLMVAVNISPRQFMQGDLVSTVREALRQSNLDPGMLELEITENVLMDELSGVATALDELHEMGVRIAIDDFGTGYSSLSYLKRYPIDKLKIDQSFVRDMTVDSGDATLVVAIIAMGHSLNIPVVAEGIETDEQLAALVESGCDMGQGFYIGKPMPFDDLLQWVSDSSRWTLGNQPAEVG